MATTPNAFKDCILQQPEIGKAYFQLGMQPIMRARLTTNPACGIAFVAPPWNAVHDGRHDLGKRYT